MKNAGARFRGSGTTFRGSGCRSRRNGFIPDSGLPVPRCPGAPVPRSAVGSFSVSGPVTGRLLEPGFLLALA